VADKLTLAAISAFIFLGIIGLMAMMNPPANTIPPTNAFSRIITQNATITADSYNDFASLSGIHDMSVTGNSGQKVFVTRSPLSGGEASYFSTTGTTIDIIAQSDGSSNMVKVGPTTTFTAFSNFDNGGADNGRIRYIGTYPDTFHVAVTISVASSAPNDSFVYGIAKNGVVLSTSKVIQKITTAGDTKSTALHVAVTLNTNDYLELYVGNLSSTNDAIAKTVNVFALGM